MAYNNNRKGYCDKRLTPFYEVNNLGNPKNRHLPGWRFLLFTVIVTVSPKTWKVNVIGIASPPFGKCDQPPAVVCSTLAAIAA